MKELQQQLIENLSSKDMNVQGNAFQQLMKLTQEPVDWAYDIWDNLITLLEKGDNKGRSIAAQVLCNLAKSDPKSRMEKDLLKLFKATKDEKFVTARHSLLALWKVAVINKTLTKKTAEGLSKRFDECSTEKNGTLIRYDICTVFRKIFDATLDEQIFKKTIRLIDIETDEKYRKKYLTVWKDILKEKSKNKRINYVQGFV